ncbi:hypothetical protein CRYUN_Cryun13aG0135200 [Craigia yunnanensis]
MLNDSYRNKAFRLAIDKTVTKPCHVLDIGAGTGLLSMMAARAMGLNGMVTACESYLPMAKLMRKVLHLNAVESTYLWKLLDLYGNEAKASDGIHLVPTGLDTIIHVKSQQYPMHCDAIRKEIKLLSEPFKTFEFDFWKRPDSHGETEVRIKAIDDGSIHAVVSWWILQLDREGTVFYSTAPRWINSPANIGNGNWCDHWKQCVWFLRGKGMPVSKGEEVPLEASHTETSVSYNLNVQVPQTDIRQHYRIGDFKLLLSPERIATYGDSEWGLSMLAAVRNALQGRVNPLCVVADDSIFLTLLAANLSKNSHVDILIGEPYYYANEGMLPWQNLRFWKDRTLLDPILSEYALIMPCKGILKACAMSLPDFWRSRCCLGEVEGFDHSVVNTTLGACGELPAPKEGPCLSFSIWQCGEIKELSEIFTILEFDCLKPISSCYGKAQVQFTEHGICHGFVLWVDWVMDVDNSILVSTGPDHRYWKQWVKLLTKPVAVGTHGSKSTSEIGSTVMEAFFDPASSELIIKHAFS